MKVLLAAAVAALALAACAKGGTTASPIVGSSNVAADPNTVVATYADKKITLGELDSSISKELFRLRRGSLESMVVRAIVVAEAAKVGKTEDQYIGEVMKTLPVEVTEPEMRQIYEANKDAFEGQPFEAVRPTIEERMKQEKGKEAMLTFFEGLKKQAGAKILLSEPRMQVAATGPSKGPDNAPITIVEFSDFQCPYCAKAHETADQVVAAYSGKVKLVFRDFPLPFHDKAQKAAEASHCAHEQGKFWEMHDWMFAHQDKLDVAALKEAAKTVGLDTAKFDPCLDTGKFATAVADNSKAGQAAGVSGTPAFFINGRVISGAQPLEAFKTIIDDELAPK